MLLLFLAGSAVGECIKVSDTKTYDTKYLMSGTNQKEYGVVTLNNPQLASLTNKTVAQKWNGTAYAETVKETVTLKPDFKFDYTNYSTVGDLVGYLSSVGDFKYTVTFSHGLPLTEKPQQDYLKSENKFVATNGFDNITVPFFGQTYKLHTVDASGTYLSMKLSKSPQEAIYYIGESAIDLEGAGAYAGQKVDVEVTDIVATSPNSTYVADFTLKDVNGNILSTATAVSAGSSLNNYFTDENGNAALATLIDLKTVGIYTDTGKKYAILEKVSEAIQLVDTKAYPYSSTDLDATDDYWVFKAGIKTNATAPQGYVIKEFSIYNNVKKWNDKNPIWVSAEQCLTAQCEAGSNEATFLEGAPESTVGYGFVKLKFDGFNQQGIKYTNLKIGDGFIDYYDQYDFHHEIPLYIELDTTTQASSIVIDDQTFYYSVSDSPTTLGNKSYDGKFKITTKQVGATDADQICKTTPDKYCYYYKVKSMADFAKYPSPTSISLTGIGMNNKTYKYTYFRANTDYNKVYLLLLNAPSYNKTQVQNKAYSLYFNGTDTTEDGVIDKPFYLPDFGEIWGINEGMSDNSYYLASFKIVDGTGIGTAYIDTATGNVVQYPNNNLSYYSNNFNYKNLWSLSNSTAAQYLKKGYSDYGSEFELKEKTLDATIPNKKPNIKMNVIATGTEICN